MAELSDNAIIIVDTRPASTLLPDGRNAHVTLRPVQWWMERLAGHYPACASNLGSAPTCLLHHLAHKPRASDAGGGSIRFTQGTGNGREDCQIRPPFYPEEDLTAVVTAATGRIGASYLRVTSSTSASSASSSASTQACGMPRTMKTSRLRRSADGQRSSQAGGWKTCCTPWITAGRSGLSATLTMPFRRRRSPPQCSARISSSSVSVTARIGASRRIGEAGNLRRHGRCGRVRWR